MRLAPTLQVIRKESYKKKRETVRKMERKAGNFACHVSRDSIGYLML
jgi:hypothetical protein